MSVCPACKVKSRDMALFVHIASRLKFALSFPHLHSLLEVPPCKQACHQSAERFDAKAEMISSRYGRSLAA
jgi:hypothetical protein